MLKLKLELTEAYPISVEVISLDLSLLDSPTALYNQIKDKGLKVDILINNAGLGFFGSFKDISWEKDQETLFLDFITPIHLTKLFLNDMLERKLGYILQVASTAAYQACPSIAVYGAAKSALLLFGEALNYELKGTNVSCTVLSPGPTRTDFQRRAGIKVPPFSMHSKEVSEIGIQAMLERASTKIAGASNFFLVFIQRFLPRTLVTWMVNQIMRRWAE